MRVVRQFWNGLVRTLGWRGLVTDLPGILSMLASICVGAASTWALLSVWWSQLPFVTKVLMAVAGGAMVAALVGRAVKVFQKRYSKATIPRLFNQPFFEVHHSANVDERHVGKYRSTTIIDNSVEGRQEEYYVGFENVGGGVAENVTCRIISLSVDIDNPWELVETEMVVFGEVIRNHEFPIVAGTPERTSPGDELIYHLCSFRDENEDGDSFKRFSLPWWSVPDKPFNPAQWSPKYNVSFRLTADNMSPVEYSAEYEVKDGDIWLEVERDT